MLMLMCVGQNIRTSNVTRDWGDGAELGEGIRAIDFQPRHLTKWSHVEVLELGKMNLIVKVSLVEATGLHRWLRNQNLS